MTSSSETKRPKALWWIGAGAMAQHVARSAEAAGLVILVTDQSGQAPGAPHAARILRIDGTDVEAQAQAALALSKEFEIVEAWCGAEFGAPSVDAVRRVLGLPRHEAGAVARALDKTLMLRCLEEAGLDVPRGRFAANAAELGLLLENMRGPLALKPACGSGSRGVERIDTPDPTQAAVYWQRATAPVDGVGAVVVESWVEGRSIDANGLMIEGRYQRAGTLEKFPGPAPYALPLAGIDPAPISASIGDTVHAALEAGARALGLIHGPVKGDFLVDGERVVTLEIAPRLHGDVTTSNTLPFGTGIDPVAAWFQLASTGSFDPQLLEPQSDQVATWRVIALPPGRIEAWPATDELPEGVSLVWHNPKLGNTIERYVDTRTIPGYVAAHGADLAQAEARLIDWFANANYRVEPGADAAWQDQVREALRSFGLNPDASGKELSSLA